MSLKNELEFCLKVLKVHVPRTLKCHPAIYSQAPSLI